MGLPKSVASKIYVTFRGVWNDIKICNTFEGWTENDLPQYIPKICWQIKSTFCGNKITEIMNT